MRFLVTLRDCLFISLISSLACQTAWSQSVSDTYQLRQQCLTERLSVCGNLERLCPVKPTECPDVPTYGACIREKSNEYKGFKTACKEQYPVDVAADPVTKQTVTSMRCRSGFTATASGCVASPPNLVPPKPRIKPPVPQSAQPVAAKPAAKPSGGTPPDTTDPSQSADPTSSAPSGDTGGRSTSEPSSQASSLAQSDVATCEAKLRAAQPACSGSSFGGSSTGAMGGLAGAFGNSAALQGSMGSAANQDAGACYGPQSVCEEVCRSLADRYSSLKMDCASSGCANSSIYSSAYSRLTSAASTCQGYGSMVSASANQGMDNFSGAGLADMAQQGLMDESTMQQGFANPNDPYGCNLNPNQAACAPCPNPSRHDCPVSPEGTAGFASNTEKTMTAEDFDLPANLGGSVEEVMPQGGHKPTEAKANAVPQQGGGGAQETGGAPKGGAPAGAPRGQVAQSQVPEVQLGRTGGWSGYGGGTQTASADGGGRRPAGEGQPTSDGRLRGVDLKKYLPGQDYDPNRYVAGHMKRRDLNGPGKDIWAPTTAIIYEKCKTGILPKCELNR